jgi:hypothetical protein
MPQVTQLDTRNTILKHHFLEEKNSALAEKRRTGLWYMTVFCIQNLSGLIETMRNFHLNDPRGRDICLRPEKGY